MMNALLLCRVTPACQLPECAASIYFFMCKSYYGSSQVSNTMRSEWIGLRSMKRYSLSRTQQWVGHINFWSRVNSIHACIAYLQMCILVITSMGFVVKRFFFNSWGISELELVWLPLRVSKCGHACVAVRHLCNLGLHLSAWLFPCLTRQVTAFWWTLPWSWMHIVHLLCWPSYGSNELLQLQVCISWHMRQLNFNCLVASAHFPVPITVSPCSVLCQSSTIGMGIVIWHSNFAMVLFTIL